MDKITWNSIEKDYADKGFLASEIISGMKKSILVRNFIIGVLLLMMIIQNILNSEER